MKYFEQHPFGGSLRFTATRELCEKLQGCYGVTVVRETVVKKGEPLFACELNDEIFVIPSPCTLSHIVVEPFLWNCPNLIDDQRTVFTGRVVDEMSSV